MNDPTLILRVRYGETDAMGRVHHAAYLGWFEAGRVELMRQLGFPYRQLEESGVAFPVIEARLRYLRPCLFDEDVGLRCVCLAVTRTRVRFGYVVTSGEELRVHGYTEHAAIGRDGRPREIPEDFRAAVATRSPEPGTFDRLRWSVRDGA